MNDIKMQSTTERDDTPTAPEPMIVSLGTVEKLTGKQPRGDKSDGGAAGGDYKYGSESPRE